jgi:hydroxymethylbilane synthase
VTAERAVLSALGGGCQAPMGAHASTYGESLFIQALIVSPDGAQIVRKEKQGSVNQAADLGQALGEELLAGGGKQILDAVYGAQA